MSWVGQWTGTNSKASVLMIWGAFFEYPPSLPLLSDLLWTEVVVLVRALSMSLRELFKNYLYLVGILGLAVRVFANGPGDLRSIPGQVIPKTLKMVLDVSLLNTQHYKVRIKGKVEQSRERSSAPPLHLGVVAIEKGAFRSPSTKGRQLYFYYITANYF